MSSSDVPFSLALPGVAWTPLQAPCMVRKRYLMCLQSSQSKQAVCCHRRLLGEPGLCNCHLLFLLLSPHLLFCSMSSV